MDHADHVNLLRDGVTPGEGVWADLGSGTGAFTQALADLLGPSGLIYSLDRDKGALASQRRSMQARFPDHEVRYLVGDFRKPLELPSLDGIVMANALHFVKHKEPVVRALRTYLKPGGHLILVEYDTDRGNAWVPHPLSFETWQDLAQRCGFSEPRLMATRTSRFLGQFFSALCLTPEER